MISSLSGIMEKFFSDEETLTNWVSNNWEPKFFNSNNLTNFPHLLSLNRPILLAFTDLRRRSFYDPVAAAFSAVLGAFFDYYSVYAIDINLENRFACELGYATQAIPSYTILIVRNNTVVANTAFPCTLR